MKKILFTLLLLGAFVCKLTAQPTNQEINWAVTGGTTLPIVSTPVYVLNQAISNTTSNAVTVTAYGGVMVGVTGTATQIDVQWSYTNTTITTGINTWFAGPSIPTNTCQFVSKQADYVRFRVSPASYPIGLYPSASLVKSTVSYEFVGAAPSSGGGGASGNATFVVITGTATSGSDFSMNAVTYASSVAGTSMQYLTLTPQSYLLLGNDNTVPLYFVITNSATAPTNTATIRRSIPQNGLALSMKSPGGLEMGYNFLHWFWPASSSATLTPTAHLGY